MSESKESKVAVYCGECGRDYLPDEAMAQALRRAIENEDRLTAENESLKIRLATPAGDAHRQIEILANLTAMKEKFYGLLGSAKIAADLLRSDKPATGKALDVLIPRIAACEQGGSNDK